MFALVVGTALAFGVVAGSAGLKKARRVEMRFEAKQGDLIFQSLPNLAPLVGAIEGVTQSPLSHCGMMVYERDQWWVLEAIGPVKMTPLAEWVWQGESGKYAVYRVKGLDATERLAMIEEGKKFLGLPYDVKYDFDDAKIYCSELLFKAYGAVKKGEALARVETLGELNWRPHAALIERIEGGPVPVERKMVTPVAIVESEKVELVANSGLRVRE